MGDFMAEPYMELLAPAGDPEIFRAVIGAGADAVYFAGEQFGARAYAKNFDHQQVIDSISYAHLHGAKAYLTVNTLLKNKEIETSLYDTLRDYYRCGLDAVLVQDPGVFQLIRECFPDLPVHISTQMSITSRYGAQFWKDAGATRIVPARELSLSELLDIHRHVDIEIEAFVHGALCMSYSGQCLMSSMIGRRSGNRGRCAQPCRLSYSLYAPDQRKIVDQQFPLSLKDLCALNDLPRLLEAGVYSLKIEGRMKSLAYTKGVVAIYRKYLDLLLANGAERFRVNPEDLHSLFSLGNRGSFTCAYFDRRNGADMLSLSDSSHHAQPDAQKTAAGGKNSASEGEEAKLPVSMFFSAAEDQPASLRLICGPHDITVTGACAQRSLKENSTNEALEQKLKQCGNTPFYIQECTMVMQNGLFLPFSEVKRIRRLAFDRLLQSMLFTREKDRPPKKEPLMNSDGQKNKKISLYRAFSAKRHLWLGAETMPQLKKICRFLQTEKFSDLSCGIIVSFSLYAKMGEEIFSLPKIREVPVLLSLPEIFRMRMLSENIDLENLCSKTRFMGLYLHSWDEIGLCRDKGISGERLFLSPRLYAWNNRACDFYRSLSIAAFSAPEELKETEFFHLDARDAVFPLYGRTPLMTTAFCPQTLDGGCSRKRRTYVLFDRKGNRFPVTNFCQTCYNIVYNCHPTFLIDKADELCAAGQTEFSCFFTTESDAEVSIVLSEMANAFGGRKVTLPADYTRGHFVRGVE